MSLTVEEIFAPDGLIAAALPGYEHRCEQQAMARAVADALADRSHLLAEAGTGVGKSFAYLAPIILHAKQSKQRAIVSTCTIALQEQLIGKDLPFLAEVLPEPFSAVLAKGRSNYLCLRRLSLAVKHRDRLLRSEPQQDQLDDLAEWAMQTTTGERQEMAAEPDRTVWAKVCAESGSCPGGKCAQSSRCFFRAARAKLLQADLVVCNHALLFSDLALGEQNILGDYDVVVLDEAHTVEGIASDHFGRSVSSGQVASALRELFDAETGRGLLGLMQADDAIAAVNQAAAASDDFFDQLAEYRGPGARDNGRITEAEIVPDSVTGPLRNLAAQLRKLRRDSEDDEQRFELHAGELRVMELADALAELIAQTPDDHAYWFSSYTPRRGGKLFAAGRVVTLASAPIRVAPQMAELLLDRVGTVVFTSATLATARGEQHGFDYIRGRLGIDQADEILLTSPFDYRSQAKVYLETRLGDPNHLDQFAPAAGETIAHYLDKSVGGCFVLATSYRLLNRLAEELERFCGANDYELLVQGGAMQRTAMLRAFRQNPRSVLLGTMSFWQGVDVAGEALRNVIITKLPFAVPDEPLIEARLDAIRQRGGNPFMEFQLPQAIILFKQGFGRLIRSRSDTGFVVILDHRVATKRYGRMFIDALPDVEVVIDEWSAQQ
jgi:ATP-dependent DNA helicase DinG